MHDIGKILAGQAILKEPTSLSTEEGRRMERHPEEGARLVLELCARPDLAAVVATHHERYDGRGYPNGLAGDEIPMGARIIAVCDAWATMCANRYSASSATEADARDEMTHCRGRQFDPVVIDAFLTLVDEEAIDELAS